MGYSGGNPSELTGAGGQLSNLASDVANDATAATRHGSTAAGSGAGEIAALAETAVAAAAGAVAGAGVLIAAMGTGSHTASDQLTTATGGGM